MADGNQPDLSDAYERLRPKQRRFVDALCANKTQSDAARDAGYGKTRPDQAAWRLLKDPLVRAAYDQRREELAKEAGAEAVQVVRELIKLGYANMADYMSVTKDGDPFVDLSKLTREQAAAIQEFTVDEYTEGRGENARDVKRIRIKLADKRGPLELIGKWLKMFTENHQLTVLPPPTFNISFQDGGPGTGATPVDDGVETA